MNRRNFFKILGGTIIIATGFAKFATAAVKKVVYGAYGKIRYPGKIKPVDERKIQKKGKWIG